MKQPLRIAFFGTPNLAVWVLEELWKENIIPTLVVTTPDKPVGRKLIPTPPATAVWAKEHDITVLQTTSLAQRETVPLLANSEWDVCIVAAYNTIIPEWVLRLPQHGILNVHPSLLPSLRGPSPIRTAIREDLEDNVGVSIMLLDAEIDHGPLVAQARVELPTWPILGRTLDELLFREGGRLLAEVLPLWIEGTITPEEQQHDAATYTKKITKQEGEIDVGADGYTNYLHYCAMDGWPGSFFFVLKDGKPLRVKIQHARHEDGAFIIETVIPEGRQEMDFPTFQRVYMKQSDQ